MTYNKHYYVTSDAGIPIKQHLGPGLDANRHQGFKCFRPPGQNNPDVRREIRLKSPGENPQALNNNQAFDDAMATRFLNTLWSGNKESRLLPLSALGTLTSKNGASTLFSVLKYQATTLKMKTSALAAKKCFHTHFVSFLK